MKFFLPLALPFISTVVAQSFPLTSFLPPCGQACVRMAIEGENRAGVGSGGAVDCALTDVPCQCQEANKDAIAEASVVCVTAGCGPEIGATAARFALNELCRVSGL